jgi:hypothetical protein
MISPRQSHEAAVGYGRKRLFVHFTLDKGGMRRVRQQIYKKRPLTAENPSIPPDKQGDCAYMSYSVGIILSLSARPLL